MSDEPMDRTERALAALLIEHGQGALEIYKDRVRELEEKNSILTDPNTYAILVKAFCFDGRDYSDIEVAAKGRVTCWSNATPGGMVLALDARHVDHPTLIKKGDWVVVHPFDGEIEVFSTKEFQALIGGCL